MQQPSGIEVELPGIAQMRFVSESALEPFVVHDARCLYVLWWRCPQINLEIWVDAHHMVVEMIIAPPENTLLLQEISPDLL